MNKYDLTKLEGVTVGETAKSVTVSPETVVLCLMALEDRARFRGAWVDDDGQISDARWDAALALVDRAVAELLA